MLSACGGGANSGGIAGALPSNGTGSVSTASSSVGSYGSVVAQDAPLALYRFNDNGTTIGDASGQGNNGTLSGMYMQGVTGPLVNDATSATSFNGGSASVPVKRTLDPTQAITIEAWVTPSAAAISASAVDIVTNGAAYVLSLRTGAPALTLDLGGTPTTLTASDPLVAGTTVHLVATYDGTAMRIFVNGSADGGIAASGTIGGFSTSALTVAKGVGSDGNYTGTLGDVAVYGTALSLNRTLIHESAAGSAAAYTTSTLTSAPIGFYPLDEESGTTAYDASTNAANGVVSGSVTYGSTTLQSIGRARTQGYAKLAGGFIRLPYSAAFFPAAFTVSTTATPSNAAVAAPVAEMISVGNATREAYALELRSGHPALVVTTTDASVTVTAPQTVSANGTYQVTGTYDGATATLYINGQALASAPISGSLYNPQTTGANLGGNYYGNNPFVGVEQNVTFLAQALGGAAVAAQAQLLTGLASVIGTVPTTAPAPATVPTLPPTPVPTLPPTPVPTLPPTPVPTLAPALPQLSQTSLAFLSAGQSSSVQISEARYGGAFTLASGCGGIATATVSGSTLTVGSQSAGTCSLTLTDAYNQHVTLPVTVTITDVQFH